MADGFALPLEKTLFIDLETAPLWRSLSDIPAASDTLVEHWERRYGKNRPPDESADEHFLNNAAIHAIYGRIVCIGLGWIGLHNGTWCWRETVLYDLNETQILSNFLKIWTEKFLPPPGSPDIAALCGHNLLNFDYIFLGRRILLNHLPLPRPWVSTLTQPYWNLREVRLIDTMRLWSMGETGSGAFIGLEVLAQVLGIPFRKSISHQEIRERFFQWQDTGDESYFQPVVEYCAQDVRTTAKIYLRLIGRSDLMAYIPDSGTL
jgi:hypothetical protein